MVGEMARRHCRALLVVAVLLFGGVPGATGRRKALTKRTASRGDHPSVGREVYVPKEASLAAVATGGDTEIIGSTPASVKDNPYFLHDQVWTGNSDAVNSIAPADDLFFSYNHHLVSREASVTGEASKTPAVAASRKSLRGTAPAADNPLVGREVTVPDGGSRSRLILQQLDRAAGLFYVAAEEDALQSNADLIAQFGVDGVMDAIEESDPGCHGQAHLVGRAAVRITTNVTHLVQACGLRCHTGCFHGVALGLVVDQAMGGEEGQQQELAERAGGAFQALCNDSSIVDAVGVGECLHAAGHTAAMIAGEVQSGDPADICMAAYAGAPRMQHYCGTGSFMQVFQHGAEPGCGATRLPGACYMYSWRAFFHKLRHGADYIEEVVILAIQQREYCEALRRDDAHRAGCIYGLAAHVGERLIMHDHGPEKLRVAAGKRAFQRVCWDLKGELLAACVEGFLLRNMKYYPKGTADAICSQWNPNWKSYTAEMCRRAAALTQYSFDRPVERYVVQA
eukprot:jgi/Tetstr1/445823/TSEL_033464.t1